MDFRPAVEVVSTDQHAECSGSSPSTALATVVCCSEVSDAKFRPRSGEARGMGDAWRGNPVVVAVNNTK